MPAVFWVLAFTVFPLRYSLYIAFFKVESKVNITRERVPVVDDQGKPVLLSSGKPKMRTIVHKDHQTIATYVGLAHFKRLLQDDQLWKAMQVTATFVGVGVPTELVLGFLLALLFNRQLFGRPVLRTGLIIFAFSWNEFLFAITIASRDAITVPVHMAGAVDTRGYSSGLWACTP